MLYYVDGRHLLALYNIVWTLLVFPYGLDADIVRVAELFAV